MRNSEISHGSEGCALLNLHFNCTLIGHQYPSSANKRHHSWKSLQVSSSWLPWWSGKSSEEGAYRSNWTEKFFSMGNSFRCVMASHLSGVSGPQWGAQVKQIPKLWTPYHSVWRPCSHRVTSSIFWDSEETVWPNPFILFPKFYNMIGSPWFRWTSSD